LAGFFRRPAGEDFFFMRLFPSCVYGSAKARACSLRCQNQAGWVPQPFLTETRMLHCPAWLIQLKFSFHSQRSDYVRLE
jgi:hypothetical protein